MRDNKYIYAEYDNVLIGKTKAFSDRVFGTDKNLNQRNALIIMKYAFTKYLNWGPEAIKEKMTKTIMKKLHLHALLKYIDFPVEYNKDQDYYYLATLVFRKYKLDMRARTEHTYEDILYGRKSKVPKDYFLGSDGAVRAGICLQYMINKFVTFRDINDLYNIFATDEGYNYLRDYRLLHACKDVFDTPVDYLHFVLPDIQKNNFFFHYYKFKYNMELLNASGRKQKSTKNYKLEVHPI